jgi:hypothetical protein
MVQKAEPVTYTTKLHANLKLGSNVLLIRVEGCQGKGMLPATMYRKPKEPLITSQETARTQRRDVTWFVVKRV